MPEFMPYFQVRTEDKDGNKLVNQDKYWKWSWKQHQDEALPVELGTISCYDLIESWHDMHQGLKQEIYNIMKNPEDWLCPNASSYMLKGESTRLEFKIEPVEDVSDSVENFPSEFEMWEVDLFL